MDFSLGRGRDSGGRGRNIQVGLTVVVVVTLVVAAFMFTRSLGSRVQMGRTPSFNEFLLHYFAMRSRGNVV